MTLHLMMGDGRLVHLHNETPEVVRAIREAWPKSLPMGEDDDRQVRADVCDILRAHGFPLPAQVLPPDAPGKVP